MKKQSPKTKRLNEVKRKHLKTVKRRQLNEIKKSIRKFQRLMETKVYTASEDDFGTFIDDFATTIGYDHNVEMSGGPIEITPQNFLDHSSAWDEFGYEKHWNRIPDGQPFKITGDTVGLTDYPSLKNYTFIKMGNVIKGKIDIAEGRLLKEDANSIVNLLRKNQKEIASKTNTNRYFPFDEVSLDTRGDASITLKDEAGGMSFKYSEDVDSDFVGQNGDKPRPITIGGVDLMYINYNI